MSKPLFGHHGDSDYYFGSTELHNLLNQVVSYLQKNEINANITIDEEKWTFCRKLRASGMDFINEPRPKFLKANHGRM